MKYVNDWIVQVEPEDSQESVSQWISEHADPSIKIDIEYDRWVVDLRAGDIINFNSTDGQAMYRYAYRIRPMTETETSVKS